jgi:ketosteroid isomerase-like protein
MLTKPACRFQWESVAMETTITTRDTVTRFVELMEDQDLSGVVDLYAPGAVWEVHVPGWDGVVTESGEMLSLHEEFFGRVDFAVDGYQLIESGNSAALRWDLSWRDREDGGARVSFQSHFFEIDGGRILRHRMYCAGVRIAGGAAEEDAN